MQQIDFFLTIEKLYLIARALDDLLIDNYSDLTGAASVARDRTLSTVITGINEIHHGLEALAMADRKCFLED